MSGDKRKRSYWIRTKYAECPVCGRDGTYRERVYGPKPKRHSERHLGAKWSGYCGCLEREGVRG